MWQSHPQQAMYKRTFVGNALGVSMRGLGVGLCSLCIWSSSALAQTPACKSLVATGNPEYSPYLWRDPADDARLIGANADLMQLLSKEIGLPIDVRYMGSWARVQELAKSGRVDLIAGAFFTLPRLEYMDYFHPAFRSTRTVVWTSAKDTFPYKTWSDLKGRKGLTVLNNSLGESFDRYAKEFLQFDEVPQLEQAFRMLAVGRAQYIVYEEDPGLALAAKLSFTGLKRSSAAVSNEGLHLTLPHQSPCNTGELRGRIAKALHKLTKENVMKQLVDTNIQRWRQQAAP
jgi:polar amino acid transport system substrate-binding protein